MDEILVANGNLSKSSWGCILIFQPLPVCTVLTLFVLLKSNNNKLTQLFLVLKKKKKNHRARVVRLSYAGKIGVN